MIGRLLLIFALAAIYLGGVLTGMLLMLWLQRNARIEYRVFRDES